MLHVLLFALALVAIGVAVYFLIIYNQFIRLQKEIEKARANIDVILKQRHDELGKLIEVCKGYMKYERSVLERLTNLRMAWARAKTWEKKLEISNEISRALKTLFALAERYPRLKAVKTFSHLQSRISGLETELADRREYYNDVVTSFNAKLEYFPDKLIAKLLKLRPRKLLEIPEVEKEEVKIKF